MDKQLMCERLPEQPPSGLINWAIDKYSTDDGLGGEFCIYTSERISITPTVAEVLEHNALRPRREWAAVCTCTACQEDFITQKESGESAIRTVNGEDGWNYTVTPGEPVDGYMSIEIQREGDCFCCPLCGSEVELIHRRKLTGGRTKRILVLSVQDVDGYTAVIYWMVQRTISEYGISQYGATPEDAYVLDESGKLVRFSHIKRGGAFYGHNRTYLNRWRPMGNNADVIDKCGSDIWPVYPDLEMSTGEKTALIEYLRAGGYYPVAYLKWWRKRRNIENLCRQGQAELLGSIVRQAWRFSADVDIEGKKYIDYAKKRPNEMIGMSKEEFRYLRREGIKWTTEAQERWQAYRDAGGRLPLMDYLTFAKDARTGGVNAAIEILRTDGHDLDKIGRYMTKRSISLREVRILLDTRKAARQLYDRALTNEELWPKQLHATHDRLNRMLVERKCTAAAVQLQQGFTKVLEKYSHLQWTDGDLEIILPKNNGELVYEGEVLRHCVGGYGYQHVGGSSVIFFVRRHRRPERPYYTLSIDMRTRPRECQLHGYGNEHHGDNKEYTHKIPQKVRAFCTRWENEVLLAWYAEQQQKNKGETAWAKLLRCVTSRSSQQRSRQLKSR